MKHCSIIGCPGEYVNQKISHMVKQGGQNVQDPGVVIIESVPADVCRVCGDTLLDIETVERIEDLLRNPGRPAHTVPAYEMPCKAMAA